jgi:hypothetical protein
VWGVRSTHSATALADRAALYATRLGPNTFVSHASAALLHGAPLPLALEKARVIDFSHAAPARAPHANGIRGHRITVFEGDIETVHGLPCTSASRTWCDLAARLSLLDLVAMGDFLIHWRLPMTSIEQLTAALARHPGRRGQATGRAAIPLLNDRSESPPESHFRVLCALAGMPHPLINHTLILTEGGTELRPDFEFREYKVLVEYQGDWHRTTAQWRKDMTRRSRLEARGWTVVEINWDDLLDPAELFARLTSILRRTGWIER